MDNSEQIENSLESALARVSDKGRYDVYFNHKNIYFYNSKFVGVQRVFVITEKEVVKSMSKTPVHAKDQMIVIVKSEVLICDAFCFLSVSV